MQNVFPAPAIVQLHFLTTMTSVKFLEKVVKGSRDAILSANLLSKSRFILKFAEIEDFYFCFQCWFCRNRMASI